MTTGISDRITKSGRITPKLEIPTPAFAVAYAAPRFASAVAAATPSDAKKYEVGEHTGNELDIFFFFTIYCIYLIIYHSYTLTLCQ